MASESLIGTIWQARAVTFDFGGPMIDHKNQFQVSTRDGEIAIDALAGPTIVLTPTEALNLAAWLATLGAREYRDPEGLNVRFAFADLLARVEAEAP